MLVDAELRAFVQQSIDLLPDSHRLCLQLRDIEELSVKQVSEILEISPENVKVRTHRARSALKRLLEPLLRGKPVQAITAAPLPPELKPSRARVAKGLMMSYLPFMLTCDAFEAFIIDYLEDDLPAAKRRLFEFHIRLCRECREYLTAYQRTREIARGSKSVLQSLDEVPEDLVKAVIQASGR